MKYLKKIGLFLVIFAFVFQSISVPISAMSKEEQIIIDDLQIATILVDEDDVPLYKEGSETSELLRSLQSEEKVAVLEKLDDFSYVEYSSDENTEEILRGFIQNDFLNFDEFGDIDDIQTATILLDENVEKAPLFEENSEESEILALLQPDEKVVIMEKLDDFSFVEYVASDEEVWQGFIHNHFLKFDSQTNSEESNDDPSEVDTNDEEEENFPEDELDQEPDEQATSEDIIDEQDTSEIIEPDEPEVPEDKSESDENDDQVDVNDQKENKSSAKLNLTMKATSSKISLEGIALKNPTSVYADTSTSSKSLKSYPTGSILKYSEDPKLKDWYTTGVYINGVKHEGYIHKSHVENADNNHVLLEGIALKNSTSVYTRASTSSGARKSYPAGSVLKYYTYSENWYKTGVYINGKKQTGYIHKSHVENATNSPRLHEGIAKSSTTVYTNASTQSGALRSYPAGSILKYYTYSKDWYRTGVYINGKKQTGYIHKSHVENATDNPKFHEGVALESPTRVYTNASTSSKALRSYPVGSILKFYTYSKDWYRTGVYINGVKQTGYIHKSHVGDGNTHYDLTLDQALKIQMDATPQTDNKYAWVSKEYIDKDNKVIASSLNVRPRPGTGTDKSFNPIGTLSKGTTVKILEEYNGWYAIEYNSKDQWRHARPEDVMYYLNPLNFINDSIQKFQFLDLARTSGASKTVLNNYLRGKGILSGQAEAFIEAGQKYGLNDIYLISHALLETGGGTSTLANGVKYNGEIVYNMYGIGAYDSCPIECGAERAYEEGWTTPAKAIIGGAEFIGNDYVRAGQNTLYKMRWNPAAMASTNRYGKQYATDIGWASKQISTMYNLYQEIGEYTLYLDIPIYK